MYHNIQEAVETVGYRLGYSHTMSDIPCGGWWDIIFDLKDWNEEAFLTIWENFEKFNKRFRDVLDQYE